MKRLLLFLVLLATIAPAHAQIEVNLQIKRNEWIRHEPLEATVVITNNAGHDIRLEDTENHPWFSFEVIKDNIPVPPYQADYHLEPLVISQGENLKRTVNIANLYAVNEYGSYSVRAAIYFSELKKYFVSEPFKVEITDGRTLWTKSAGVPDTTEGQGGYRSFSTMSFQRPDGLYLYARVENQDTKSTLATYPLGRMASGTEPTAMLGGDNTLYVFHLSSPNTYLLSKIGVNGEWLSQSKWNAPKSRATIRKKPDGSMVVVGANRENVEAARTEPVPKLSDRPVALPR